MWQIQTVGTVQCDCWLQLTEQTACDRYGLYEQCNVTTDCSLQNRQHVTDSDCMNSAMWLLTAAYRTDIMCQIQTVRTVQCDYWLQLTEQTACDRYRLYEQCNVTTDCSLQSSTSLLIRRSWWTCALVLSTGNLQTCNIKKYGII